MKFWQMEMLPKRIKRKDKLKMSVRYIMDEDEFVDLLDERVEHWTDDPVVQDLFHDMYQQMADEGVFYEVNTSVMAIVDNDYVNYCDVIYDDDDRYEEVDEAFKNGDWETESGMTIEAEKDGVYLVRV